MTHSSPTIADLIATKDLSEEHVFAAAEAYLEDPKAGERQIANGFSLDLFAALKAHVPSLLVLHDVHARASDKRQAVVAAVLLARAQKA